MIGSLLFSGGCAKPTLLSGATKVQVLSISDTANNCKVVDVISGRRNQEQGAASGALIDIKNEAYNLGANKIRVISSDANPYGVVTVTAEALQCE